ncbi:(2E,6E)-farnesyl diphosphate synthase [Thiohalobacter sp. IOR34]|uniref:(2E,6E)-farnesyl diphosphate synthase n=1 Tax=Thiohalobacter sp. IOR34 TaxID=3057176 RepID=UPI0025B0C023|nr:farnesyl diphosphate synthase [Thiohalobacter sp. IOR34]WJW76230.1 (2E,6E)-farnesyl diphosphate synthase [Thiohalobacter sp. IOR34]
MANPKPSTTPTPAEPGLQAFLDEARARIEAALQRWLPAAATHPQRLHEAMRYATLDGGKRIRPVLVYASGRAVGAAPGVLDVPAAALECIHAYSLIHDDLPAMDDDELRRGRPTCHRAFGEAEAILAGDALQTLAFDILARRGEALPPATRLRMIELLARSAGSRGMVGGQAIDLASVGQTLTLAELEDMHIHKTGALIRAGVVMGALCRPDVAEDSLQHLDHYAKCIGLAFQIQDDILDVEGDTATLGKTAGADQSLDKPTYPALLGLDGARSRARELVDDALHSLREFDATADPLRGIARYIVERNH